MVGAGVVGDEDGSDEGKMDGNADGTDDSAVDGSVEGVDDGGTDGTIDGAADGLELGTKHPSFAPWHHGPTRGFGVLSCGSEQAVSFNMFLVMAFTGVFSANVARH